MQAYLIVGLGNPGKLYEKTRHNMGFKVVDRLSEILNICITKKQWNSLYGQGRLGEKQIILSKPQNFMNLSGQPVYQTAHYFGISTQDMVVIYDDIDLPFNQIKIKEKGGHGGHNGMKSLIDAFGHNRIPRIRMGIGRPSLNREVVEHVLGQFTKEEEDQLNEVIIRASDAVVTILNEGIIKGMNKFNK
ncbi:MAG: aminoacyl-tRNA hydrolase [Desulfobacterales bacterium]|nr:aminoacyl-tRNA hydrolase [Desulfobacterales bacterium]